MKDKLIAISITIGIFLLVCIFLKCNDTSSQSNSTNYATTPVYKQSSSISDIEIVKYNSRWIGDGFMEVFVLCRNNSDTYMRYVQINASFFDEDGNPVGSGIGNTESFPAHSEKTITVIASNLDNSVKTYRVNVEMVMP